MQVLDLVFDLSMYEMLVLELTLWVFQLNIHGGNASMPLGRAVTEVVSEQ